MKKIMSRLNKALINGFMYLSPIGAIGFVMAHLEINLLINEGWIGAVFGSTFLVWILCTLYFLFSIIINKKLRENIFTRLAGIKERDEREEVVVGRAMKSSFLFMLGLLVCLLVFSTTRTDRNITLTTPDSVYDSFTLGHLEFKGEPIRKYETEVKGEVHNYETYDIPLSKTSLILFMILAQLFSYHFFARKELMGK
jgi:hypothetical protein